ncbi:MAG: GGDEF domain-containing protein [Negativicutes bacterium]
MRENEERFRSFVENANDIVYSLTLDGIYVYVSPNWTEIFGHETSEIIGHAFTDFVHPDDHPTAYAFLKQMLVSGEKQSGLVYRVRHKNGDWKWQTTNATLMRDAAGKFVSFLGIGRDITEGKRMEEELQYQATTDGLTGIFNRRYFLTRADEELQRIQRVDGTCSLLMLDIDHFKRVDDKFGHAAGDTALKWITLRCREATRSRDFVGRIRGDEFAILLLEIGILGAKQVAERLRQNIQDTAFKTEEGIQIPLSVSIGIAEHSSKSESPSELMIRADKALYRAKNEGRNKVVEAE